MIWDYSYQLVMDGFMIFPAVVLAVIPTDPADVKETITIIGQPSTSISLTGSVDDQE